MGRSLLRLLRWVSWPLLIGGLVLAVANGLVVVPTAADAYGRAEDIPPTGVAVVLGTSRNLLSGEPNPYFYHRLEAAAALYKLGKVDTLLLTGSSDRTYYNEPAAMAAGLLELGVPAEVLLLDTMGNRTLESFVRARDAFGLKKLTVVTQGFHSYRALYICNELGLEANALRAEGSSDMKSNLKMQARELLARPLALIDLHLTADHIAATPSSAP